jgi:hypothetical protein
MIGNFFYSNSGGAAYEIEQSLRFDGSSSLSRTFGSGGNRQKWTYSFWFKQSRVTTDTHFFLGTLSGSDYTELRITGNRWSWNDDNISLRESQALARDPSAWYHVIFCADTTLSTPANRQRIYVNGEEVTDYTTSSYYTQNNSPRLNSAVAHYIGIRSGLGAPNTLNGYMAEVHFIDNQQLAPSDFGEFDDNGVWRPIAYTGSYGTNGFYLKFDPSATNGIGHDHSGNGNNFSPTGFSTSGTGTDVMSDTPTTNWATLNPIFKENTGVGGGIFINGNLEHQEGSSNFRHTVSTQALPSSGKVYVEVESDVVASNFGSHFGLMLESTLNAPDSANNFVVICQSNGTLQIEGTNQGSQSAGDVFSLSVDMSASPIQIVVRKNNTVVGTNPYTLSTTETLFFYSRNIYGSRLIWNFGQRDFAYTPPTGYKALNTANLPEPDIADGSQYFNAVTYSGSASNQAITVGFQPDFLWIKRRNGANDHNLYNAIVGLTGNYLVSNSAGAENSNNNRIVATSSTGFTVGTGSADTNGSGNTYVAWAWDAGGTGSSNTAGSITSTVSANPSAGFSIATYTGNGTSGATIGHGLGVAPAFAIFKSRNASRDWLVYHQSLGATKGIYLSLQIASETDAGFFNNTSPSSTLMTIGNNSAINVGGQTQVAYFFSEVEGYSKFGSYIGNTSTDGVFIYTGFRPAFVLIKLQNASGHWCMYDSTRYPRNPITHRLYASGADAETNAGTPDIDFVSNGFKLRTSEAYSNNSSYTYIFAAFAEHPTGGANVSPATAR